jgi:ATP-dependent phosphoenolpyruvate carboxykinase
MANTAADRATQIQLLGEAKLAMDELKKNNESVRVALGLLSKMGNVTGYKPAFRCLVNDKSPEESIRWQ